METLINRRLRVMVLLVRRVASSSRRCIRFTEQTICHLCSHVKCNLSMGCVTPSGMRCGRHTKQTSARTFPCTFCMHIRIGRVSANGMSLLTPQYRTRLLGYTPPFDASMNAYFVSTGDAMRSVRVKTLIRRRTCQLMICLRRHKIVLHIDIHSYK